MGDIKPFSRRQLGHRRRAWIRKNALLLTLAAVAAVAMAPILSGVLYILPLGGVRWYAIGWAHAGAAAAFLHLINTAFFAHDREAITHVRGAWGEDNTHSELTIAKRRRLIWDWIDSITLQSGDIDHLVITRRGGVLAIDSKWRNAVVPDDIEAMAASARTAANRATWLTQTLLAADRTARHRAKVRPLHVTPLVVVWGSAQHDVPPCYQRDGVSFVAGRRLRTYLRSAAGEEIDRQAAHDLARRLTEYRRTAWETARQKEESRTSSS